MLMLVTEQKLSVGVKQVMNYNGQFLIWLPLQSSQLVTSM